MSKTYRTLIEIDTKNASKSINDLKQEVQDLNGDLSKLDKSTDEYAKTQLRAQQATQNLNNALEQVVIDGELVGEKMGHVARIGAGLAGGFELVAGAMALSGKESEKFEKAMQRVAGAMAITNALSAMGDAFESIAKISPKAALAIEKFGKTIKSVLGGIPGIVLAASAAIGALFIKIRKDSQQTERYLQEFIVTTQGVLTEEEELVSKHLAVINAIKDNESALLSYYKENKEAIDKVAGSHKDYNDAIQAYIDKAPEYIEYLHKTAMAELITDELVKKEYEIMQKRQEVEEQKAKGHDYRAWKRSNELGVLNQELRDIQALLNKTNAEIETAKKNLPETTTNDDIDEETKKLIKQRREYKLLHQQLQEFASTVSKLNNLPINPQLEKLLSPSDDDVTTIRERNAAMLELESTVIRLQDEATSISFFNRFKDTRNEEANRIARLLRGESTDTDQLKADRDKLQSDKGLLIDEQSKYDKETAEYQAYADKIKAIDEELASNLEETSIKFQENRKEGIQSVEDIATMSADVISNLLGSVASNLEEGSAEFKAIKTAETVISTLTGSMKAYESLASIPYVGPVLGAAAAASVIATGVATVSQIHATEPGNASINNSVSQLASIPPTTQSHVMNETLNTKSEDTRVYVLESDIRKTSNKVRVAESESRF